MRVCKVDVCGVEMECERGYVVCAVTVVVKCEASVCVYVCMIYNFQQLKTLVYQCCYSNPRGLSRRGWSPLKISPPVRP